MSFTKLHAHRRVPDGDRTLIATYTETRMSESVFLQVWMLLFGTIAFVSSLRFLRRLLERVITPH